MTYISWDNPDPVFFHPKFGLNLEGNAPKGIRLPDYGNYGGPTNHGGFNPKDPEKPVPEPVDVLDKLFEIHDHAIDDVQTLGDLVWAHATLIKDIHDLLDPVDDAENPVDDAGNPVYDAGPMVYGGAATFALAGQLATGELAQFDLLRALDEALMALTEPAKSDDQCDDPPPYTLSEALNDAQGYMETGLAQLLPEEAGEARSLHGILSVFEEQFADFLVA